MCSRLSILHFSIIMYGIKADPEWKNPPKQQKKTLALTQFKKIIMEEKKCTYCARKCEWWMCCVIPIISFFAKKSPNFHPVSKNLFFWKNLHGKFLKISFLFSDRKTLSAQDGDQNLWENFCPPTFVAKSRLEVAIVVKNRKKSEKIMLFLNNPSFFVKKIQNLLVILLLFCLSWSSLSW